MQLWSVKMVTAVMLAQLTMQIILVGGVQIRTLQLIDTNHDGRISLPEMDMFTRRHHLPLISVETYSKEFKGWRFEPAKNNQATDGVSPWISVSMCEREAPLMVVVRLPRRKSSAVSKPTRSIFLSARSWWQKVTTFRC